MATAADPVLIRFRAALDRAYGPRIERVVLFGSHAQGDERPDSDYNVLVFFKDFDLAHRHEEMGRISKITADIVQDTGELISALPYPAGSYTARTPLMHEVRRGGRPLPRKDALAFGECQDNRRRQHPEVAARDAYCAALQAGRVLYFRANRKHRQNPQRRSRRIQPFG